MGKPSLKRRAVITVDALRYIANHMEAALDLDTGPHDIVETDADDAFLVMLFKREADKLRARADRMEENWRLKEAGRG